MNLGTALADMFESQASACTELKGNFQDAVELCKQSLSAWAQYTGEKNPAMAKYEGTCAVRRNAAVAWLAQDEGQAVTGWG